VRYAGGIALAAAFGAAALVLAVAAGGPCEDGTAADFRTVACDPRGGGLDTLRVALFVASPLLALAGGLVAAQMGMRWPLVAGAVAATLALGGAVWVGTLDAPAQPVPEVESMSVAPATCSPTRRPACSDGLTVRLAVDARSTLVVGVRPLAGGSAVPIRARGPGGRRATADVDGQAVRLRAGAAELRVTPTRRLPPGDYLVLARPTGLDLGNQRDRTGQTAQARFTVSR